MAIDIKKKMMSIPGATVFIQKRDGYWMEAPHLDVVETAKMMLENGARLSTISAYILPGEETEVIYHYYHDQQSFNIKTATMKNSIASISTVLPAADWIEREIKDLYKVEFVNHPHPRRLIQPVQLQPGLFREEGGAAGKARR
jgi:NADH:ubiquinone oxidoreductase subunit C